MNGMQLMVRMDGSAYLVHHGVKGMRWGVRHDDEPAGNGGREKVVRQKRSERIHTVNGKTYKESFGTAWAKKRADKFARKSETPSVAKNIANAQMTMGYKGRAEYFHKRDVGRTMGTNIANISGRTISIGSAATLAAAAAVGGSLMTPAGAALVGMHVIGAGTSAIARRREYKRGANIISGRKKVVYA